MVNKDLHSARPRLVDCTVTDDVGECLWRVALGRPIPAVNKKTAAKCEIQTTVQQLLIARPDIR